MLIQERLPADGELARLLAAAFQELVDRYGLEGRSQVGPDARFLVATVEERAVGCGCVQPLVADTGELKRMYVAPEHRGRGVARALLAALEELALGLGYRRLRLATGVLQPEAISLYESSGYGLTEPYGKYVNAPLTRCYEKTLAPPN
ncbi:GNAT family N-acetyltransferase [Nonomuraea sp. SMC257]|uniref:GNAT family N-acetyltransferase n=1 Tax=Nonomuraea montanisoli TaxID=2741721 RepID=A0A7Y6M0K1_9ACTN|nr:GNAT family N-acetyltransferase [Nonomuraea montanisoli]NUW30618.1 GNAT family N-acetyltransferase [Nonomuraea montanisoli]